MSERIFELKIEEDDELSGIDSISLVDEPAIEVSWLAFNKIKEEEFHIPEGEDGTYLGKLAAIAQNEQELFDDGWVIDTVEILTGKKEFATNPNADSEWDDENTRVRYKYMLRPEIKESSIIPTTRDFCKDLVQKNYVWRVEEMDDLRNDFGAPAIVWRGGYNCRHVWGKIRYKKEGDITNKASVNKNKETIGGIFPTDLNPDTTILGYPQPSTITEKTAANPSPSTIKNLGLSKMDIEPNPCWPGYEPIGLKDDGSPNCVPIKEEMEVDMPHYTKDGKLYEGPTHKDANGRLMTGAVHTEDSEYLYHEDELGYDNNLPSYVDEVPRKKKKKDMSKVMFANDEKRIVIGPAMIPDLKIFRKDSKGNPYYVFFSSETIKMIAEKYMKNKYIDNNDTNHDGEAAKDVYVIESWIKDSENDKSTDYGYGDLPVGTWFVSMKVRNDEVWKQVKEGKLNGFSVSGYFEEVAQFCMEEMFLKELADLLKNIKD